MAPVNEGGRQDCPSLHSSSPGLRFMQPGSYVILRGQGLYREQKEATRVVKDGFLPSYTASQTPASCLPLTASSFETKENQQNPLL